MRRRTTVLIILLVVSLMAGSACTITSGPNVTPAPEPAVPSLVPREEQNTPLHGTLPPVVTDSDLKKYRESFFEAIGEDLHDRDFRGASPAELARIHFDTRTKWPDGAMLPVGFDPHEVMQRTLGPGLSVKQLHMQGIRGKGISVAIIDHPMLPTHQEFDGRIEYLPRADSEWTKPSFHGMATASILVGKNTGIAPDSFLYFFPLPRAPLEFTDTTSALEQVLALNSTLPPDRRIRVVSISSGWTLTQVVRPDVNAFAEAIRRTEATGVAVVHCSATMFPTPFNLGGAPPFSDRDSPDSYEIPLITQRIGSPMVPKELLVPGDYLTVASAEGPDDYVYFAEGGLSWAAPFIAGLIALAMQVNPDASLPELYRALDTTATRNSRGLKVLNPVAFIDAVRQMR